MALYSKTTQTDDERISVGEFSLGSQEFDYDEDMLPMDGVGFRGRAHSHDLESPLTEELASIIPGFAFTNKLKEEPEAVKEESAPVRLPELSEEEKAQIMASRDFQMFFHFTAKVIERALAEDVCCFTIDLYMKMIISKVDIFIDYARDNRGEVVASSARLKLSRTFLDEKWSSNRTVTGIAFSEQHPELMAVAYDHNRDSPTEPPGVILVWNTKFKKGSPEYIFHCQSRLSSVAFARFHSHLVMGGCYSGQICMWDNRVANKKTPIHKSPLSTSAHTHPVYALEIIGSHNAHNLVSISTDGKMCSWNVDNLTQPVDGKELLSRQGKQIPCLCMSFPIADMNNFVVGSEDGHAYALSRHGTAQASAHEHTVFDGHTAPICGIAFHRATGPVDLSHLFLSASSDWTVKLWSTKDPKLRFSFESHNDYVFDVAWSPVHPAVFTSIDAEGNLFLWNLNEDIEGPVSRISSDQEEGFLKKICWADNGQHICVGDDKGNVKLYDVHESMYVLRSEEWTRFARVLGDMKQTNEEADEISEVMSRLSTSTSTSTVANLAGVNVSPRQNW
uniref:WD_REPEATS_REGION domain-containing protein n=1 Tax=Heterorhabditis bacteriophora TaxID=37862 RepID=A0A1I7XV41_HETBA